MRYLLLLVILLPSCGALQKMEAAAAEAKEFVAQGRKMLGKADRALEASSQAITKVETTYRDAKILADTNKDGKTDAQEWMKYLLGALGVGGVGGGGALVMRNAKSAALKDDMKRRIERLENSSP